MHLVMQEERDILLTADIGGTNCRFSLWAANIRVDVVYDEIFTKVAITHFCNILHSRAGVASLLDASVHMPHIHAMKSVQTGALQFH